MTIVEWITAALLALPVAHSDRDVDPTVKRAQLEMVASAIASAAERETRWPGSRRELAGLLAVVARFESGLALFVHSGECPRPNKPAECDRGRARGLWQQQAASASSWAAWVHLTGVDRASTDHAAREAARALTRARNRCRSLEARGGDWVELTLSSYAGRGCVGWFRGREQRVKAFRKLVAQ